MAYFAFIGVDKPDAEPLRLATRDAHREYVYKDQPGCRLVSAGPLADAEDTMMVGTLLVFDASDIAAVKRFTDEDPYAKAGVFARTEIFRWRWNFGLPAGGA